MVLKRDEERMIGPLPWLLLPVLYARVLNETLRNVAALCLSQTFGKQVVVVRTLGWL